MVRLALTCLVVFAGCTQSQMLVILDTDLSIPDHAAEIRVLIESPGGEVLGGHVFDLRTSTPPLSFGLAPADAAPDAPLFVEAQALAADGQVVVAQPAYLTIPAGKTRYLMVLAASCVGVRCSPGKTCAPSGCREEAVDPDEIGEVVPGEELAGYARPDAGPTTDNSTQSTDVGSAVPDADAKPPDGGPDADAGSADIGSGSL